MVSRVFCAQEEDMTGFWLVGSFARNFALQENLAWGLFSDASPLL